MATEKRLIDAHDLWSDIMMLPHNGDMISSEEVEQAIMEAHTVDAVKVVRCENCKKGHKTEREKQLKICWCDKWHNIMRYSDYCSYGERKSND